MKIFSKALSFILLILVFSSIYAQKYYEDRWKIIEENYMKGTYKNNLSIVLEIQKNAMKENNSLQLIRSLRAEFAIINQTNDDEKNNTTSDFFARISSMENNLANEDKSFYKVLVSGFVIDYYRQNLWKIQQRTNLNSQDLSQIETWTKLDFKNYIAKSYNELDKERNVIKNISFSKYNSIFTNIENSNYFPTLWDWYSFNKVKFFSNKNLFTKNELQENQKIINSIFDDLIAKNSGNSKLYFSHQKLLKNCEFSSCKDKLQQLQNLMNSKDEGDYKVLIAEQIMSNLILEGKEKEAVDLGNSMKNKYEKSAFINNITNEINQIKNPYLTLKYEDKTQANLPIHLSVDFKNVSQLSLNIYQVKDDYLSFIQYTKNPYKESYSKVKKSLVRKDVFQLNDPKDYKLHKTSLEVKPLKSGIYIAEYEVSGDENDNQNFYFFVTNNTIIYHSKDGNQSTNELKLVNAEHGKSIANENITFYEFVQNKSLKKVESKTNEKGIFKFPTTDNKVYYRIFLIHQPKTNDFQMMQLYGNHQPEYNSNKQNQTKSQIFTDRAIYRPGQTVYFKVINTKLDKDEESVISGLKQKITLKDANNQEVSAQNFTTNEFGSYHGSFILPKGKLNGSFSLSTDGNSNGYRYFRVEEYKRPKFEVTFEPLKEDYKYGQVIELKGKAIMFSGVALSNTNVNYEIKKQNIRWRYFPWYSSGNDNENSILGEVKTDDKGEFIIKLDLKKDEKIEGIQIDNYQVNASVTDINGETQSTNTNVKVASVSHYIKADNLNDIFSDENVTLNVETKNYNEQNLQKSYQAKLSKLENPNRIFRNNFSSEIQNLPKLSKDEFVSKFPHDYYDKNDEKKNWKSTVVFDKKESTQTSKDSKSNGLNLGKLEAGSYQLELYNIEGKDTIKTTQYFDVWDKKTLKSHQKTFLSVVEPKDEVSRGSRQKVYVYSSIPNAIVNVFLQDGLGKTKSEVYTVKNGILEYTVEIPTNKEVNSLNIQFQIVAYNDVQTETVNLKIKNSEQPLRIETITFRDKLEPNSKEKWTVKVSGSEKEKINAEVLANMYDMSLDQFSINRFNWETLYTPYSVVNSYNVDFNLDKKYYNNRFKYLPVKYLTIPQFNWFDRSSFLNSLQGVAPGIAIRGSRGLPDSSVDETQIEEVVVLGYNKRSTKSKKVTASIASDLAYKSTDADGILDKDDEPLDKIPIRQNLNETAFFYPDLKTDAEGNITFEFTSPEALTKWKLMFLAHTKDARSATLEKEVITQKEFSVTPNYPRFLREGDELNLQSKLSNLSNKKLNGSAQLQILDAFTNEDISEKFGLNNKQQSFELNESANSVLSWKLNVPKNTSAIILKVVAKAGQFSDGEQKDIAILPNRILVTDAVPIFVKEGETKTFEIENLKNNNSKSITNVSNTLELTTNPIWEIMFALPSLKNEQNNSADVVFNKWFADVLASEVFRQNPKMKTIFEEYQNKGLLKSNLEKNQELKQLLLEETPWVLESKNENEQMQKLALLFDVNTMKNSINQDWEELKKLQNPDGGFSWYQGYPSSYSTSLYILKNLGKINLWLKDNMKNYQATDQNEMVKNLVAYIDREMDKYTNLKDKNVFTNWSLDYLDTRNYWGKKYPLKGKGAALKNLIKQNAKSAKLEDFTFFGLHRIALLTNDYGLKEVSNKLLNYLKETSVESKNQGVYWKQNLNDWGWFNSKIVNHAGAIEAFNKLKSSDEKFIEEMKVWLITQKEVNSWGSSRGTTEVIFTILNSGKSWTNAESDQAKIVWGGKELNPQTQATGHVKSAINSENINKNLATVTITKSGAGIAQGGLFWQYYEDLDKIKSSENTLSVTKELYRKIKTVNGEELQKITENEKLKVGDKVTVRMILNTDRPTEFVHIKDMRAAGFEPLTTISGYQWKNNLGYYQSTKDASTNFYIQYMPKGKYVFEYDLICNASGRFSNGITTLQNYYAPQMNSHTKGIMIQIVE